MMAESPSISIVMPVYNGMPYLEEAVDSVLAQRFTDWELLISDDGSRDCSRDFLQRLEQRADRRIQVFLQEKNLGIFCNLNFLFTRVKSDLVSILCNDDWFSGPGSLEQVVEFWRSEADERVGAVRLNGKPLLDYGLPAVIEPQVSQFYFFLFGNLMGNLSQVSCRKSAYNSTGLFDQTYPFAGDFEYWARLSFQHPIRILKQDITVIRRHAATASVYLNLKGELYSERSAVTSAILSRISPPGRWARWLLAVSGTLIYDSALRFNAIRRTLRGDPKHLKALDRATRQSSYGLNPLLRYLLFLMSGGAKIGKRQLLEAALKANCGRSLRS